MKKKITEELTITLTRKECELISVDFLMSEDLWVDVSPQTRYLIMYITKFGNGEYNIDKRGNK